MELSAEISYFILKDVSALAKKCKTFGFGYKNRVFGKLVGKITFSGIRFAFGEYVPDSGQEHTAYSNNSFFVPTASLYSAIRPEQSQIWAVLRAADDIHRIRYSLCAGFLGRLCLSGDISEISDEYMNEVSEAIAFYNKVKEIIRSGYTQVVRCTAVSYEKPDGYQAVLRTYGESSLLIVHTFENGANPPIDDLLCGKKVVGTWGSELTDDFRAKVFLLEKQA